MGWGGGSRLSHRAADAGRGSKPNHSTRGFLALSQAQPLQQRASGEASHVAAEVEDARSHPDLEWLPGTTMPRLKGGVVESGGPPTTFMSLCCGRRDVFFKCRIILFYFIEIINKNMHCQWKRWPRSIPKYIKHMKALYRK